MKEIPAISSLFIGITFLVIGATTVSASPVCDFDGDGMSDIALVSLANNGNYNWYAFNPRTEQTKTVVENFGNSASKLIPGNWFESGIASAAIVDPVTPGVNGRAVWIAKSLTYSGGVSQSRNLGRSGDIIILGGDYDGNGITDSLILKKTTGMLGLRVNYFLSTYNGNNLGKERLYKALGSPFKDPNFFFSPDGFSDYLAVRRNGKGKSTSALQLKPFTDSPQSFSVGSVPVGSRGPLPLKEGEGNPDLLAFFATRGKRTLVTVKTVGGITVYSKNIVGNGTVSTGDYLSDHGWEIAIQNGSDFTILNPMTKSELTAHGPGGKAVSCVSNQTID